MIPPIVREMLQAGEDSLRSAALRIDHVRPGPIVGNHETITFTFDGVECTATLRDRALVEHVWGLYPETDRRAALAAMLAESSEKKSLTPTRATATVLSAPTEKRT